MAFTGKATYDDFTSIAEDVSDIIGIISPSETPLLDFLGDAERPGRNINHEWLEDSLGPGTVINSTAIASATADTSFQINGKGNQLQVGDILRYTGAGSLTYEELLQVTIIVGANSITVSRDFGTIGPSSLAAGGSIELVANASLEGKDAGTDISKARSRKSNYMQIFDKVVQISGTEKVVRQLGGITNEYDYQSVNRMKEILRDLERAVILGETSGNSIGSDTLYRTMKGGWRFITTNVHTVATFSQSFLDHVTQQAWNNGGNDLDLLVAGAGWKREVDALASGRIRTTQDDLTFRTDVRVYQSAFGEQAVQLNRWMPSKAIMILSSDRMDVVPLAGRFFQEEALSKAGDYDRTHIVGEYTLEFRNEDGTAKAWENS